MKHILSYPLTFIFILLLTGCGGTRTQVLKSSPQWDHRDHLQIAILPVLPQDKTQSIAAEILRGDLYTELSKYPTLHILEPQLVDSVLQRENLLARNEWNRKSERFLGELLHVDALMRVKLTRFGSTYYIIESTSGAGAEIELIDVHTGEILWRIRKEISRSKGLTGLPTGLSSVVLEPMKGMGRGQRTNLLRQLGFELASSFDPTYDPTDSQINILKPEISRINAFYNPNEGYLDVEILATPDCRVFFNLADFSASYPCQEFSPGVYRAGFLYPGASSPTSNEMTIRVISKAGATIQEETTFSSQ